MRATLAAIALLLLSVAAYGHEAHGVNYRDWVNRAGKGCCNERDCQPILDADVRTSPVLTVRIEGQWCPVLAHHYLSRGNAPDWSTAHVCVQRPTATDYRPACERLLCFQPKPFF